MKIFWSWQSDHQGKISRHFVRGALERAIAELKQEPDIEEAARDAELDHDRKGVPGSPDLANIILEKIRNSDVFVGDVTPVGHVTDNPKKRVMNSNVAIELGYALATLTDRALLMVLNEEYGAREDLPFDLKQKAGPIIYRLSASADQTTIDAEKSKLVGSFKVALREIVVSGSGAKRLPFEEQKASENNPGSFFQKSEFLARRGSVDFRCDKDRFIFVRVIPTQSTSPLSRTEAVAAIQSGDFPVFNDRASGRSTEQNKYGVIVFESERDTGEILSAAQLFKSREIWAFDAYMLNRQMQTQGIPTGWHEYMIARGLYSYVSFATKSLKLSPPLLVEVGLTNIEGFFLFMDQHKFWEPHWGPIHEQHVIVRRQLTVADPKEIDGFLLDAFEAIFDAAGATRPEKYNNFPGASAGTLPQR